MLAGRCRTEGGRKGGGGRQEVSGFGWQVSDGGRAVHVGTEAGLTPTLRRHSHPASDVDADPEQRQRKCLLVEPEEEKVLRVRTSRRCYTRSQMDDAYRLITFPRPPLSRTLRDLCRWVSGKGSRPTARVQGPQPGCKANSQGARPTAKVQGPHSLCNTSDAWP